MFKGQFKEAHDRATDLVDTNCQIFEDAIRWMYSGELGITTEHLADQIGDDEMIDRARSPAQGEEGDHENCRSRVLNPDNGFPYDAEHAGCRDKYDVPELQLEALIAWQRIDLH
jgi:hypothetical protein